MNYKYTSLPKNFFRQNRNSFIKKMDGNSVAIFHSLDQYPTSADGHLPFKQSTDILYLCGIDQEKTILIIEKSKNNSKSYLFVKETNDTIKIWEGENLNKKQAKDISGVENVFWLSEYNRISKEIIKRNSTVYTNINHCHSASSSLLTADGRFAQMIKKNYPKKKRLDSYSILEKLRKQKKDVEIEAISKACEITRKGFIKCLKSIKPNIKEYQLEAIFAHTFIKNAATGFAYEPIIASGKNNNVLHYLKNNKKCKADDLILMDVGASYANYCADMTRTVPVNGKYSKRQKEVYNAVLRIKNNAAQMLVNGNDFSKYKTEVIKMVNIELVQLGLISKLGKTNKESAKAPYRKYFMHGISHHLGLDTHDYGTTIGKIKQNMVLTVEPGIYIPKEGFGVRLEDNYVVQKNGCPLNLMKNIPIEIEEIESLINQIPKNRKKTSQL